jgi:proton-dependent oligopeptide transporter, POT family
VIFVLFIFAAIFWSAFEQAPTSLNLFARDFTDRNSSAASTIPATWFQSVNSAFIILCAPVFAALWTGLAKRGVDLSSPTKFALGLLLAGLGLPAHDLRGQACRGQWRDAARLAVVARGELLLPDLGELCLSPVGLSSMTKLSPRKLRRADDGHLVPRRRRWAT